MKTTIGRELSVAIDLLSKNEVVAIPTETVYGLAGNALNIQAVQKIFAVKNRPLNNPLIVHLAAADCLTEIAENIPELAWQLLEKFSPGPLTLLLPKKYIIPDIVTAGLMNVAVRIPKHNLALELLRNINFPLAAPSANPFGYISPTKPEHVLKQLGGKISYILDGGTCEKGIESTVVGFENDTVVIHRLGAVSMEEIKKVAGKVIVKNKETAKPASPGMLSKHYSPKTKIIFTETPEEFLKDFNPEDVGVIAFKKYLKQVPTENQILLSPAGDLNEAAKNLYSALHVLDSKNLKIILAEKFPDKGNGKAINDRLGRAADLS